MKYLNVHFSACVSSQLDHSCFQTKGVDVRTEIMTSCLAFLSFFPSVNISLFSSYDTYISGCFEIQP